MKWSLAEASSVPGSGKFTALGSQLAVGNASTRTGFNIGRINGRLLALELSALEQKQQVDIIASPRLLASHMQPASIKQGSEIPYQVSRERTVQRRSSSKRPCWEWRSRQRCCSRTACA